MTNRTTIDMLDQMYKTAKRTPVESETGVIYEVDEIAGNWHFANLKVVTYDFLADMLQYNERVDQQWQDYLKSYKNQGMAEARSGWRDEINQFLEKIDGDTETHDILPDYRDLTVPFDAVVWEDEDHDEFVGLVWLHDGVGHPEKLGRPVAFTVLPEPGRMDGEEYSLMSHTKLDFWCVGVLSHPKADNPTGVDNFAFTYLNTEPEDFLHNDSPYGDVRKMKAVHFSEDSHFSEYVKLGSMKTANEGIGNYKRRMNEIGQDHENVKYILPIKDRRMLCPICLSEVKASVSGH